MVRLDLHVHSCSSYDGLMSPKAIFRQARRRQLAGVAVTDHDTIAGGLRAAQEGCRGELMVIVGSEVHTEVGDIIGLFLKEQVTSHEAMAAIDEIHAQRGIAILPHPYRHHPPLPAQVLARLDAVETHNGRAIDYAALAQAEIAGPYRLVATAGSDAHLPWEVGRAWVEIDGIPSEDDVRRAILSGRLRAVRCSTPPSHLAILLSKVTKRWRRWCARSGSRQRPDTFLPEASCEVRAP